MSQETKLSIPPTSAALYKVLLVPRVLLKLHISLHQPDVDLRCVVEEHLPPDFCTARPWFNNLRLSGLWSRFVGGKPFDAHKCAILVGEPGRVEAVLRFQARAGCMFQAPYIDSDTVGVFVPQDGPVGKRVLNLVRQHSLLKKNAARTTTTLHDVCLKAADRWRALHGPFRKMSLRGLTTLIPELQVAGAIVHTWNDNCDKRYPPTGALRARNPKPFNTASEKRFDERLSAAAPYKGGQWEKIKRDMRDDLAELSKVQAYLRQVMKEVLMRQSLLTLDDFLFFDDDFDEKPCPTQFLS